MLAGNVSLRYFILGLLTRQPLSGYDIKRFVKSLNWLIGGVSSGGLYPALRALLEEGLVTVDVKLREDRPPRKIYTITDAGERELRQWVDRPAGPDTSTKAFIMRLILASNYSRAGLLARMEQRRLQAAAHRLALDEAIAGLGDSADLGQRLALDYALSLARAELAWLDRELGRVSQEASPVEVGQSILN
jgi:PadR family transcriptional regulator AphA